MHLPARTMPLCTALLCTAFAIPLSAEGAVDFQDVPKVVEMVPANGAVDVDPSLSEIVITFSEPMKNMSWSVMKGNGVFPNVKGVHYREGFTVFVMEVALEPGTTYVFGLNGPSNPGFKNRAGVPLEPVSVTFTTSGEKRDAGAAAKDREAPGPGRIEFDLFDANGVRVRSQDYKDVPLFLSSGAAW